MDYRVISLDQTSSTNLYLREALSQGAIADDCRLLFVRTDYQMSGRGCGTNRWESQPHKNLLYSVFFRPLNLAADQQFILSMANAVALSGVLSSLTDGISIKWPNDIYHRNNKLCGTLIENSLSQGQVKWTIIGNGINVNQDTFPDTLPNPTSLSLVTSREHDLDNLFHSLIEATVSVLEQVDKRQWDDLRTAYRSLLFGKGETRLFRTPDHHEQPMTIVDVSDSGRLLLNKTGEDGKACTVSYAFKEIEYII